MEQIGQERVRKKRKRQESETGKEKRRNNESVPNHSSVSRTLL
jgi:hypothetical protein